tara:strand:- start:130 stop:348 length:219 start_codon:yes stop_codon:yes gene_type:complete
MLLVENIDEEMAKALEPPVDSAFCEKWEETIGYLIHDRWLCTQIGVKNYSSLPPEDMILIRREAYRMAKEKI